MALIATITSVVLTTIKFVVGLLFDSQILIADAFHSGSDVLTIFASWCGLWVASRRKTKRFPYGLYKAETIVTLVIGVLITMAGWETLSEGYKRLLRLAPVQAFPVLPVLASVLSVLIGYVLAKKEKQVGQEINSQSLLANAADSALNVVTSLIVLAGIVLAYLNIRFIEGGVIILIAFFILKLGVSTIWISLLMLLDANLDPELQTKIGEEILRIPGIREVMDIKIRPSGPFRMVDCRISTSPSLPVYKAHELADRVERVIEEQHPHIDSVFVHVEPATKGVLSAIIPVKEINGMESRTHGHFGRAPYFVIVKFSGNTDTAEIEDFFYNEFLREKQQIHIGVKVIRAVLRYNLDLLFTSKIGEISFSMLRDHFVEIFKIEANITVTEVIDLYRKNLLENITKPTHTVDDAQISIGTEKVLPN